ncbi:MAG: acetylxylan esterase [Planctomycetota bacterium]|nr:acetylxylan esterase [Planctomycetota bacterium]
MIGQRSLPSSRRAVVSMTSWFLGVAILASPALGQRAKTNEDEAKVPAYTLPDPLVLSGGERVRDAATWNAKRRPEIVALFETQMYGKAPGRPDGMTFVVTKVVKDALGGKATRKEVSVLFTGKPDGPRMDLLVYVPNQAKGPFPAFVGLNFDGNHGVDPDPRIPLARGWVQNNPRAKITDHKATEESRGSESSRWALERVIDRGFAVATAYYGDIDPDFDDGFQNGVHALFSDPGKDHRSADAWGSVAAWAWGLRRAMDYLETDPSINGKRVAVMGHSRLGKAAIWAGAQDTRFAVVISNDSGEGGAALSRRKFGETTRVINTAFPHWFCGNYKQYMDREDEMPFDQHMLVALVAPRPVLICSAAEDLWADPKGEFLAGKGADPVYRLLGTEGLGVRDMPGTNVLVWSRIGYHIRPGKHDVTNTDWDAFMDFAERHTTR